MDAQKGCFGSEHGPDLKRCRYICPMLFEELVIEILEWLPIKSVARFRCVSQHWHRIFRTRVFINNHRRKQGNKGTMLLMRRCSPPLPSIEGQDDFLSFHDLDSLETLVRPSIPILFLKDLAGFAVEPGHFHFVGSCDGIVCIKYGTRYILCNPALQEFKALPLCSLDCPQGFRKRFLASGFGTTDNLHVILMHGFYGLESRPNGPPSTVTVHLYSLRTKSWRKIDDAPGYPAQHHCSSVVFLDGASHWCGCALANGRRIIFSLHINSESFKLMELPECLCRPDIAFPAPVLLNGCIGVVQFQQQFCRRSPVDVWVMKEYGVKESWTKMFTLSPQPLVSKLLPWKNDIVMVYEPRFGMMHLYEDNDFDKFNELLNCQLTSSALDSKDLKRYQVYGARKTMRILIYEESLVSILD